MEESTVPESPTAPPFWEFSWDVETDSPSSGEKSWKARYDCTQGEYHARMMVRVYEGVAEIVVTEEKESSSHHEEPFHVKVPVEQVQDMVDQIGESWVNLNGYQR